MGLCVLLCRSMLLFCCCTFISHFLPLLLMIFRLSQSPCVSRSNKCTFSVEINTFYRRPPVLFGANDNANDWRKIPFRRLFEACSDTSFFFRGRTGRVRGDGWNAFTLRFHSTLHAPSVGAQYWTHCECFNPGIVMDRQQHCTILQTIWLLLSFTCTGFFWCALFRILSILP